MSTVAMLPVGAIVAVTEPGLDDNPPRTFVAKVIGYDLGRTKYELGARYAGWGRWLFGDGGVWAFPSQVRQITEEEAQQR
jgi:hypothetical protein